MPDSGGEPVRLGGVPKGRIQRYFCVDDERCQALSMVSADAQILKRTEKTIRVLGREITGWEVELEVAPTDAVVKSYPDEA